MFDAIYHQKFAGKTYGQTHGNAFDRGTSDSYYSRARDPHKGGVGGNSGPRVNKDQLTQTEIEEYNAGYDFNEYHGDKKNYGNFDGE